MPAFIHDPDQLSQGLFVTLFLLLGATWLVNLLQVLGKQGRQGLVRKMLWAALVLNVIALAHRWLAADHAPWANQYESATMVAFGVLLLYAFFEREAKLPLLGLLVLPAAMVAIAAASLLPHDYKRIAPLMPALQSPWLTIHVSLMLISYGAFASTFALSLLYLIRCGVWTRRTTLIGLAFVGPLAGWFFAFVHKQANSAYWAGLMKSLGATELAQGDVSKAYLLVAGKGLAIALVAGLALTRLPARLLQQLPDENRLDELNYRSVAIGFPLLTLGIILGAFWGHVAWGRYWAWDPKETWAFISWLIFAFFLHMRVFGGWDGKRIAWVGLIGAGSIVFTYWGVNFLLSGLHAYAK